ncbi:MAG: hypothetical protein ACRDYW_06960 [Acidimicrobiales bacterium]
MTTDAAHRASIYEKLRSILGDEDANILMSEFPSVEAHELVTKDFLRAELSKVREEMTRTKGELRAELAELRMELRGEMGSLETRLTRRLGSAIAASTALLATIGLLS